MEKHSAEEILEIIKKHLKEAEADLEKCRRGGTTLRIIPICQRPAFRRAFRS